MASLSVFLFRCADTDLHALTLYRSGDNLPVQTCGEGQWIYKARLLLTKQSLDTLPLDAETAIEELKRHGLFLARLSSGIISFPR